MLRPLFSKDFVVIPDLVPLRRPFVPHGVLLKFLLSNRLMHFAFKVPISHILLLPLILSLSQMAPIHTLNDIFLLLNTLNPPFVIDDIGLLQKRVRNLISSQVPLLPRLYPLNLASRAQSAHHQEPLELVLLFLVHDAFLYILEGFFLLRHILLIVFHKRLVVSLLVLEGYFLSFLKV